MDNASSFSSSSFNTTAQLGDADTPLRLEDNVEALMKDLLPTFATQQELDRYISQTRTGLDAQIIQLQTNFDTEMRALNDSRVAADRQEAAQRKVELTVQYLDNINVKLATAVEGMTIEERKLMTDHLLKHLDNMQTDREQHKELAKEGRSSLLLQQLATAIIDHMGIIVSQGYSAAPGVLAKATSFAAGAMMIMNTFNSVAGNYSSLGYFISFIQSSAGLGGGLWLINQSGINVRGVLENAQSSTAVCTTNMLTGVSRLINNGIHQVLQGLMSVELDSSSGVSSTESIASQAIEELHILLPIPQDEPFIIPPVFENICIPNQVGFPASQESQMSQLTQESQESQGSQESQLSQLSQPVTSLNDRKRRRFGYGSDSDSESDSNSGTNSGTNSGPNNLGKKPKLGENGGGRRKSRRHLKSKRTKKIKQNKKRLPSKKSKKGKNGKNGKKGKKSKKVYKSR